MTPTTREVAVLYHKAIDEKDMSALANLVTPDAEWWVIGSPEYGSPFGGAVPFSTRKPMVDLLWAQFATWGFALEDIIVEGNKAVLTGVIDGDRFDGKHYHNDIVMIISLENGKVKRIQEWVDLKAVDYANRDVVH